MISKWKKRVFLLTVAAACVISPALLQAALIENLAASAKGLSLASAVTAFPEGVGALTIHHNPAGLTAFEGVRFDNGLLFGTQDRKVHFDLMDDPDNPAIKWAPFGGWFGNDPFDGKDGKLQSGYMIIPYIDYDLPYLIAPGMGLSYKPSEPDSRVTFGFAQYAPYGVGLKHHDDDPLSYYGKKAFFMRMALAAPAIAYKLTDTLSIGAAVTMGPALFGFETNMRSPNTMVALTGALGDATKGLEIPVVSELTLPPPWFGGGMHPFEKVANLKFLVEDYFTTSYNVGLLWEPYPWFAFGACYQSESESNMKGDYKITYSQRFQNTVAWLGKSPMTIIGAAMFDLPYQSVPTQRGTANLKMTWPSNLQFGIKLRPIKQVILTCDVHRTDWEAWPELKVDFDQKIQIFRFTRMLGYTGGSSTLVTDFGFKNTWNYSYGIELRPIKKFAIRAGYEDRPTSIAMDKIGPLPINDMQIISGGITINVEDQPKPKPRNLHELLKQINHASSLELIVSRIKIKDLNVPADSSTNLNSIDFTDIVYNPYAGLTVSQEYTIWMYGLNQVFRW